MEKIICITLIAFLSACASLQTPKETNIAVSSLLDEIQIAINEIDEKIQDSSLPPFQSATIKLSTSAGKTTDGKASLVLSGEASKTTTNSHTITLELVPNPNNAKSLNRTTGHEIAEYVIAAVTAIDEENFLKLKTLNVEAGLEVKRTKQGGIEIELSGVSIGATHSGENSSSHNLKLTFAYPKDEKK
jgi:hypothetical protein